MSFQRAQDRRVAGLKALQAAFAQETTEAWHDMPLVLAYRFTEQELAALAWACLKALPAEIADDVCETCAGAPMPSVEGAVMSDAKWWALMADGRERKAYLAAIWRALAPSERARFLQWAGKS